MRLQILLLAACFCLAPGSIASRAQENGQPDSSVAATADPATDTAAPSAFQGFARDLISPRALLATAPGAVIDQMNPFPKEWGEGRRAFEKRVASLYGQFVIGDVLERSVRAIDHEKPRFERRGSGNFFTRMGHIIVDTVTSTTTSGARIPAYSTFANDYGSWAIATLWCPPSQRNARAIFGWGTANVGTRAAGHLITEFWPDVKGWFHKKKDSSSGD